jgi:pimeloyl-ACP methyl ester carboxylesterase
VRQLAAVTGTGSLVPYSKKITAPTVVIHGAADPLLRPRCGRAVTKAIPGAKLHMIKGMGHDLPEALWPRFTEVLTENFAR